jgi:hypothetical protein
MAAAALGDAARVEGIGDAAQRQRQEPRRKNYQADP